MNIYVFGWPSNLGGSDTKVTQLLPLLAEKYTVTVVPTRKWQMENPYWREFLTKHGIKFKMWSALPKKLEGWGFACCNPHFLSRSIIQYARRRGLKIAWSNEMMWHFPRERALMLFGMFDTVLYLSQVQREALEPGYALSLGAKTPTAPPEAQEGWLEGIHHRVKWHIVDNFVDPEWFPFHDRFQEPDWATRPLRVGRLSRADPTKFPPNFPSFYEGLGLKKATFRVMGWNKDVSYQWPNHHFDSRWELLPPLSVKQVPFLYSLDLFIYSLGPDFKESWGRAVVEAMLTGAVPLIPKGDGHHLENLVTHGVSGFLCSRDEDYGEYARLLENDPKLRKKMSFQAREDAMRRLCDRERHRQIWDRVFHA